MASADLYKRLISILALNRKMARTSACIVMLSKLREYDTCIVRNAFFVVEAVPIPSGRLGAPRMMTLHNAGVLLCTYSRTLL